MTQACIIIVTGCIAALILCIILIAVVTYTTVKIGLKRDSFAGKEALEARAGYLAGCPDGSSDMGVGCLTSAQIVPTNRQSGSPPCPPGFSNTGLSCVMPPSTKPYNPCKDGDVREGRYCYTASATSECKGLCPNVLTSPNGESTALLNSSGMLVVSKNKQRLWINGNAGSSGPYKLQMQDDGNLVVYNKNNVATWATGGGGGGDGPYKLIMQDDGNLVVYDKNGRATWASQSAPQVALRNPILAKMITKIAATIPSR